MCKKLTVIRFDKQRGKYRVDMGKDQKTYVGRTDTLEEAVKLSVAVERAYKLGMEEAPIDCGTDFDDGFKSGFEEGATWGYAIGVGRCLDAVDAVSNVAEEAEQAISDEAWHYFELKNKEN